MTKFLAITTCNSGQWTMFGRTMAQTFVRYWPSDVRLRVYSEDFDPTPTLPIEVVNLYDVAGWLRPWKERHREPSARGTVNGRYTFRYDAVRFAHKVAAIGASAESDCDVLIWLDADIVTHDRVTETWLSKLFPEPAVVAWLDREPYHPDTGFVMYRLAKAREVIQHLVHLYQTDAVFKLAETHDAYVFRHVMQKYQVARQSLSGKTHNIGHPFVDSLLSTRMDHLKGGRKTIGRTPKRQRTIVDNCPYWRP